MVDIYIAYDNVDEAIAAETASQFEQKAISVWLRSREKRFDGSSQANLETEKELTLEALKMLSLSRHVIVIISSSSLNSGALCNEINNASERGKVLTVLQIDDVVLSGPIKNLLGNCQRFDAQETKLNKAIAAFISATLNFDKQRKKSAKDNDNAIDDTKLPAAKPSLRVSIAVVLAIAIWGYWSIKNDSDDSPVTEKQSIERTKD